MAIVAKMVASTITVGGGGHLEACKEWDEGAIPADWSTSGISNLYTDVPVWLEGATHVRRAPGQAFESIELNAVALPAGSDPDRTNAKWAMASPRGKIDHDHP